MYKHTYEGIKTHSRGGSVSFGKLLLTVKAGVELWSVCVCVSVSVSVHMAADQKNVNTSFS